MASSPFADKLPAEIRVMIYGHVFGPVEVVKRNERRQRVGDSAQQYAAFLAAQRNMNMQQGGKFIHTWFQQQASGITGVAINTAILTVDRKINEEAIDTFYKTKTISADEYVLKTLFAVADSRNNVERIESWDRERSNFCSLWKAKSMLSFPRLKRIFFLVEFHGSTRTSHDADVCSLLHSASLGPPENLKCIDIGRFSCSLNGLETVDAELHEMWSAVKITPHDYDALSTVQQYHRE